MPSVKETALTHTNRKKQNCFKKSEKLLKFFNATYRKITITEVSGTYYQFQNKIQYHKMQLENDKILQVTKIFSNNK